MTPTNPVAFLQTQTHAAFEAAGDLAKRGLGTAFTYVLTKTDKIPRESYRALEPVTPDEFQYWDKNAGPVKVQTPHTSALLALAAKRVTLPQETPLATPLSDGPEEAESAVAGALAVFPEIDPYPTLWTNVFESARYYAEIGWHWGRQVAHFWSGFLGAFELLYLHPIPGGLYPENHPWVTGLDPSTGDFIWPKNVLFRTEPKTSGKEASESDEKILERLGKYLAFRAKQSASTTEHPAGKDGRMPHAVNYMHGASHYNSGWFVFNDVEEAIYFLSDPKFIAELKRFYKAERREILFVLRDRGYEPFMLLCLAAMLRTETHWFSNQDGPKKVIGWGNPSPYPVVNTITGAWLWDVFSLKTKTGRLGAVRPPVAKNEYFQDDYEGSRIRPRFPEILLAAFTEWSVLRRKGDKNRNSLASPKPPKNK